MRVGTVGVVVVEAMLLLDIGVVRPAMGAARRHSCRCCTKHGCPGNEKVIPSQVLVCRANKCKQLVYPAGYRDIRY